MLSIREIYKSIQGETSHAGLACTFVRLAACDLRCSWCDSEYSFSGGTPQSVDEVLERVREIGVRLVTVTGGEPLLQPDAIPLIARLADDGRTALVETSGAHDISAIDRRATIIMDLKCPSSGESSGNRYSNIEKLKPTDELKFVVATEEDYHWMKLEITARNLSRVCPLLVSWAAPPPTSEDLKPFPPEHHRLSMLDLAERILADNLPVRFLPQIHKTIWGPQATSR